VSFSNVWV